MNMLAARPRGRRQLGIALVTALIMLVVMTATALMVFRMSNTGSQIVGNMQFRNEALASADATIQEVISTTRMFETPAAVFTENNCGPDGVGFNQRCYDMNGDDQQDIKVDVANPACVQVTLIPNAAVDYTDANARECLEQEKQSFGVAGTVTGTSLCARTVWEILATGGDFESGTTGASQTVVQGVGVQVVRGTALTFCD